jgi:SAM-dependent methyltransferase
MTEPSQERRDPERPQTAGDGGETPWYVRFFGPQYIATYADLLTPERTRAEVEFIERTLQLAPGEAVLDAACGHGRHLLQLASRGYRLTGVDLDGYALDLARQEAARHGLAEERVRLLRADLRELPYAAEFDAAYNYFTAFGYLEDEAEDERALRAIARALRPGGRFLLETLSAYRLAQVFQPRTWQDTSTGYRVLEERSWDLVAGRMHERRILRAPDGREREEHINLRLYTASELAHLFARCGLSVEAALSAPDGAPYTLRSMRLALLGRKGR